MIENKLKFYTKNGFNTLLTGRHGVGKTAIVMSVAKSLGYNLLVLNGATMNPWLHLVGMPKEKVDEDGNEFIKIVPPESLSDMSDIDLIFIDEYNRTHKDVRNATMDLIQFKSINGNKVPKLKCVIAAINPDDMDDDDGDQMYDVEKIDPAQKDRFHIQLDIPYKANKSFFKESHGDNGALACDWWNKLPQKVKDEVSPRRLDYALQIFSVGGDLSDCLPVDSNPNELNKILKNGGMIHSIYAKLVKNNDINGLKDFEDSGKDKELIKSAKLLYDESLDAAKHFVTKTNDPDTVVQFLKKLKTKKYLKNISNKLNENETTELFHKLSQRSEKSLINKLEINDGVNFNLLKNTKFITDSNLSDADQMLCGIKSIVSDYQNKMRTLKRDSLLRKGFLEDVVFKVVYRDGKQRNTLQTIKASNFDVKSWKDSLQEITFFIRLCVTCMSSSNTSRKNILGNYNERIEFAHIFDEMGNKLYKNYNVTVLSKKVKELVGNL